MANPGRFEKWAARARDEAAPQPDVADAVIRRLRQMEMEAPAGPAPWMWMMSAASAGGAAACAILGYRAWVEMSAPWTHWARGVLDWWVL